MAEVVESAVFNSETYKNKFKTKNQEEIRTELAKIDDLLIKYRDNQLWGLYQQYAEKSEVLLELLDFELDLPLYVEGWLITKLSILKNHAVWSNEIYQSVGLIQAELTRRKAQ